MDPTLWAPGDRGQVTGATCADWLYGIVGTGGPCRLDQQSIHLNGRNNVHTLIKDEMIVLRSEGEEGNGVPGFLPKCPAVDGTSTGNQQCFLEAA